MATAGWISANAFQDGALSADDKGRAAMADGYITTAKIADGAITPAKLSTAVAGHIGVYDLDFYDLAVYG